VQRAASKAIADSVEEGMIPRDSCRDLVIVCGVFTHWGAEDQKKIFQNNHEAIKLALKRAWTDEPKIDEVLQYRRQSKSPWD
jgi:5,6,7,8-tetrahydromethanopterin hydro-lyase